MTTLLGKESVTVERRTGDYVDGLFVVDSTTTFPAIIAVQPAPGRVLERLPEGARSSTTLRAWAEPEEPALRTADTPGGILPDVVIRANGLRYHVHETVDWTVHDTGLPHRSYILVREESDE
ncbi:MAG: hypothetical protein V3V34_11835 [Kiloniellales bacterium]